MGKKRKHGEEAKLVDKAHVKKCKTRRQACWLSPSLTHSNYLQDSGPSSRKESMTDLDKVKNGSRSSALPNGSNVSVPEDWLARLTQVISEVLGDQGKVEEYTIVVGKDVVASALSLGQLLQPKSSPLYFPQSPSDAVPNSSSSTTRVTELNGSKLSPPIVNSAQQRKGYPTLPTIGDKSLEEATFTHQGTVHANVIDRVDNNYERLEFMGDAYLELFASRLIYSRFPNMSTGRLSQLRESLVKNETLSQFAMAYGFDERAHLPKGVIANGPNLKIWQKTLADIFEAYVAAVVLSDPANGVATAEKWLGELWEKRLSKADDGSVINVNAKQELARKTMSARQAVLEYREELPARIIKEEGKVWFYIGVYLTGWGWEDQHLGSGRGLNKSEAGQRAAMEALLNPLTAQMAAIKRSHDAKVKGEREKQQTDIREDEDVPSKDAKEETVE
ncbi:hypothetical protein MMC20_006178 [Loxospora ochrophaea]|nr:hypothetical protein [Loxospora ochrophaea]